MQHARLHRWWLPSVVAVAAALAGGDARANTPLDCVVDAYPRLNSEAVPTNTRIFLFVSKGEFAPMPQVRLRHEGGRIVQLHEELVLRAERAWWVPRPGIPLTLVILRPEDALVQDATYFIESTGPLTCVQPWATRFTVSAPELLGEPAPPRWLGQFYAESPGAVAYATLLESGEVTGISTRAGGNSAMTAWWPNAESVTVPVRHGGSGPPRQRLEMFPGEHEAREEAQSCGSSCPTPWAFVVLLVFLAGTSRRRRQVILGGCVLAAGGCTHNTFLTIQVDAPTDADAYVLDWRAGNMLAVCTPSGRPRRCTVVVGSNSLVDITVGQLRAVVRLEDGRQLVHVNRLTTSAAHHVDAAYHTDEEAEEILGAVGMGIADDDRLLRGLRLSSPPHTVDPHDGSRNAALMAWTLSGAARRPEAYAEFDAWLQEEDPGHVHLALGMISDADQDGIPDVEDPCPLLRHSKDLACQDLPDMGRLRGAALLGADGPLLLIPDEGTAALAVHGQRIEWMAPWADAAAMAVDLDLDGNVDVLTGNAAWRGDGTGGFQRREDWAPPAGCTWTGVADINADGHPDPRGQGAGCNGVASTGGPGFLERSAGDWVDVDNNGRWERMYALAPGGATTVHASTVDIDGVPPAEVLAVPNLSNVPDVEVWWVNATGQLRQRHVLVGTRRAPCAVHGRPTPGTTHLFCGTYGLGLTWAADRSMKWTVLPWSVAGEAVPVQGAPGAMVMSGELMDGTRVTQWTRLF